MPALFALIFIVLLACTGLALWLGSGLLRAAEKSHLAGKLQPATGIRRAFGAPVFIEEKPHSAASRPNLVDRLIGELGTRAAGAGLDWSGAGILAACIGLAVAGAVAGWFIPLLVIPWFTSLILATALGASPLIVLSTKRTRRLRQFQEQFPEALDFIARAIRAGHAFSVSLEMLADEAPAPSRVEWQRVFREHSLGSPLEQTLLEMVKRVPLVDVKFFVSAVVLQREAGGNLGEILTNLAITVRERFRLMGHIQAATAHARITALLLSAIPLVTLLGLQFRSPFYVKILLTDPDGQLLLIAAFMGQIVGYLLMRKVVDIRV
ncbi:MAG: type II secretion system F family protein [Acidobacteria bacterium]|nr:type II secretion system F family protein [Acidobacteriota bacterium]